MYTISILPTIMTFHSLLASLLASCGILSPILICRCSDNALRRRRDPPSVRTKKREDGAGKEGGGGGGEKQEEQWEREEDLSQAKKDPFWPPDEIAEEPVGTVDECVKVRCVTRQTHGSLSHCSTSVICHTSILWKRTHQE